MKTRIVQKISPFLWFDDNAEEAAKFYTSIFKKSKIVSIVRHIADGIPGGKPGAVLTVEFVLEGQTFVALNGGPVFQFNEALSLVVNCASQREVDYYWEKLSKGGQKSQCGWLKDKFGVSWQVVPIGLIDMFKDKDQDKVRRALKAMMKMRKLDLAAAQKAYRG